MDEKPAKPEGQAKAEGEDKQLNIKVKDSDGNEVQFKIKRTTPMSKLMSAYASRLGVDENTYRFNFDGNRISPSDTPDSLDMEDMDCIDAMVYQQGGH
ncbi:Small ubiquitin-related modifier 1 [Porphyridium purpureum]|uniref:Small ubiquitin-related modifier 1 n=1 Tax=Porphyridium purpureum TaxID=35688 RepID=A0A5J4YMR7_PORPP|nr:Small ubiquitin-related modifier 1 [Porphyridium purpureum]|eukprot:POR1694..scf249_10